MFTKFAIFVWVRALWWGWVCACVNEICMEVTGFGDVCVGVGMGVWGVGGWLSVFWTNVIVYMLILTICMSIVCLTQFGQK